MDLRCYNAQRMLCLLVSAFPHPLPQGSRPRPTARGNEAVAGLPLPNLSAALAIRRARPRPTALPRAANCTDSPEPGRRGLLLMSKELMLSAPARRGSATSDRPSNALRRFRCHALSQSDIPWRLLFTVLTGSVPPPLK